jgi:bifunctional non-homologous end joining protein LigD
VSEFSESKKPGTVYIDYSQNSHGKTMVCPYSLRATPNATVSFPISWSDFTKGLKPENYTLSTVAKSRDTPWKGMLDQAQKLEGNIN